MSLVTNKLRMAAIPPKYGEPPHWIREITPSGTSFINAVAVDSADNIIAVGMIGFYGVANGDLCIIKYNTNGEVVWSRSLGTSGQDRANGVAIDSSDNIIVCGRGNGTTSTDVMLLAKYDSSGTLLWSRTLSQASTERFYAVAVDSSDNIVAVGGTSSTLNGIIAKYDTNGNLTWQKLLVGSSTEEFTCVDIDSSNNIYVGGYSSSLGTNYSFFIAKYNSSGDYQWGRKTQYGNCNGIKVDRFNDIYAVGRETYSGINTYLLKYNSSGTLLYKIRFGTSTDSEFGNSITIDRSDNIIIVGQVGSSQGRIYITKRTPSGSQIWSRTITKANTDIGYAVAVDSTDNIILGGSTQLAYAITAKIHPDGIGTGVYSGYTYTTANAENVTGVFGTSASITEFTATVSTAANANAGYASSSQTFTPTNLIDITV